MGEIATGIRPDAAMPPASKAVLWLSVLVIAGFGVLGAMFADGSFHREGVANLDGEHTLPALWSGLLLLAASIAAVLASRALSDHWVLVLAAVFAYMAVDEVYSLHEELERTTGVDWIVLMLPVIVVGAIASIRLLRRLWGTIEASIFCSGAVLWAVAVLLELWQWDGDVRRSHYEAKMVPEEMLEMLGSLLFLVALLAVWERTMGGLSLRSRPRRR